jgi:hypothetical protein
LRWHRGLGLTESAQISEKAEKRCIIDFVVHLRANSVLNERSEFGCVYSG